MAVWPGEAKTIGEKLRDEFLSKMAPGQRLTLDLVMTAMPDDGVLHKDEPEKNYSASYDWLQQFSALCLTCAGFEVA